MNIYKMKGHYILSGLALESLKVPKNESIQQVDQVTLSPDLDVVYILVKGKREDPLATVMTDNMTLLTPVLGLDKYMEAEGLEHDQLLGLVEAGKVVIINVAHDRWWKAIKAKDISKWRVHLVGLGDVGSNVAIGMRLLGGDVIKELGIYGRRDNVVDRWEMELNQISSFHPEAYPDIVKVTKEDIFNCDAFVFCASKGVPKVGDENVDVRMVQFENNDAIIRQYAKLAREEGYEGLFLVVSDPVDLLCMSAYDELNKCGYEFPGDKVIGFGLGVMNARAEYFSRHLSMDYHVNGRAYGPHGKALVIANDPVNYHHEDSLVLTEAVVTANLKVRELGFKPFIGPAYSSGAIAITDMLRGNWHYSCNFLEGCYFGSLNRRQHGAIEVEHVDMHHDLKDRLRFTVEGLKEQWAKLT